jgi:hypothetical protein
MARRVHTAYRQCAADGCRDTAIHEYQTLREKAESDKHYAQYPYKCTRHIKPDQVLSLVNAERTAVLEAGKSKRWPDLPGLYWNSDEARSGSGFVYGPGFKAYADDFPPGTRLVITARIELPGSGA